MKNQSYVFGQEALISLNHKGKELAALISVDDLEKVSSISGRWYAMDVGGKNGEKLYCGTKIGGVTVYLHQIVAKNPPKTFVDHINHDTLDNRRENLRVVTNAENQANRKGATKGNKSSGLRNVYRQSRTGSWYVQVKKHGKIHHFGTYKSKEEANIVAKAARKQLFGDIVQD